MAGVNKKVREVGTKTIFPDIKPLLASTVSFLQGDLLIFDALNHLVAKPTAEADGAYFLGVAPVTVTSGHLADVYVTDVNASVAVTAVPGPEYGSVYKVVLKTGDAITTGAYVYLDPASGTRNVTVVGTKAIGVYQGPALTAVAGQEIEVLIGARVPGDALHF
jgi:hypothetical protein